MDTLRSVIEAFLHVDQHLDALLQQYGAWTYPLLCTVIFMETGLVVTPILPGDSLLFAAGMMAARGGLNQGLLFVLLTAAAIAGDNTNYWIGRYLGPKVLKNDNSRIFKKSYLDRTHAYFEKYGALTIVVARFTPIVRTFAPFVAGVGAMTYPKYLVYSVLGAVMWVGICTFAGYFLGNIPVVRENFELAVLIVVGVSLLPGIIEWLRHREGVMVTAVFGRSRIRHRQALAAAGVGAPDPFGRPGLRYLTGTSRKRNQVLREFEGRGGFSPDVERLEDHLAGLWHRYGDGRAILADRAVALLVRKALDATPDRWPSLAAIPDRGDAARSFAELDRALAHRRAEPPAGELADLRRVLGAAVARTAGLRQWEALEALLDLLRDPPEALARTLGAAPWVILDEPVGGSALLAEVAVELALACAAAGSRVVMSCGSGRDEGGREVAALLGWEPADRATRVFAATAPLRKALFERVATGEVEIAVASASGLVPIEPWTEWSAPADRTLADAVADQLPVTVATADEARAFAGPVRLVHPADPEAEVRWVARELAALLSAGVDPGDCAVLLADPGYASLVATVFADHDLPFEPSTGWPLRGAPVAAVVRRIVAQAVDGFDPDGICAIADFVGAPGREARRWCRSAGIRRGRPRDWVWGGWVERSRVVSADRVAQVVADLDRIAEIVAPLADDLDPLGWSRRLHEAFGALGLPTRCADGDAAHAWAAVVRTVDGLVRDLVQADPGAWPAALLREELDRALLSARFDPSPRSVARVSVLAFDEAQGLTAAHAFALGLTRGAFPSVAPPSLIPGETAAARDRTDRARWQLGELLRNAADDPRMRTVTLSWPATRDGAAVAPSPLLSEVLDLPTEAGPLGSLLVERVVDRASGWSSADRRRAAVLAGQADDDPQVAVVRARTGPIGPYDGILRRPPPAPSGLSVSAVETYLACPARYWYAHVLRLAPTEDAAPELEPRRRGIALHAILERFLRERDLRPLVGAEPSAARRELHAVATAELDRVEAGGGFDPVFQRYARLRWLAGLQDPRPAGILRAWLDAEIAGTGAIPVAVEDRVEGLTLGGVAIRGIVDRVDRLVGGAQLVTDYKTGAPPTRARIEAGLALQPVAYAEMVARRTGKPVAAAFLSLARADRVRRTAFVGEAEALDAACTPAERRRAIPVDPDERTRRLERAGASVAELVAGRFPPTRHPPELAGCRTCPYRRICRLDRARHSEAG